MAAATAFAGEWTGHISESKCGAKHNTGSAGDVSCVKGCIKGGAKLTFASNAEFYARPDGLPGWQSAYGFEFERERAVAAADDATLIEHVYPVGHDVIEQSLVVGNHQKGAIRTAQGIDTRGHRLERVNVEA